MRVIAGVLLGCVMLLPSVAAALDVTRCGQRVERGTIGDLMTDLDCPTYPGTCAADTSLSCMSDGDCPMTDAASGCDTSAPLVDDGGVLRLNGHTLSSHNPNLLQRWALQVGRRGTVLGPGTVTAPEGTGIAFSGKRLVVSDVELRDSRFGIAALFGGKIRATNIVAHDLGRSALYNARQLRAENVTVTRCGLDGSDLASSEAHQVWYRSAIGANRMTIVGLVATDNGGAGVVGESIRIRDGSLSGNAAGLGDWDIVSFRRPRLAGTTCTRSGQAVNVDGFFIVDGWFVCAGD